MTTSQLRVVGLALLAAVFAACNELPTGNTPGRQTTLTTSPTKPDLQPNSRKYRDQTLPYARARSGSASLEARALLARDGTTTIDLTTSDFEAASAPGVIANVQLKAIMPFHTRVLGNWNKGNSGGWTNTQTGLHRYDRVQAQAVVRGIDGARSDVVTVTERVNLLPDLKVHSIDLPPEVAPNVSVPVFARVGEVNGDVGARASCVLYVDGVSVDYSNNIWIANGDVVTCAFYTSFSRAPSHRVTVKLENVKPSDWDPSNNELSVDVAVRDPSFYGTFAASDYYSAGSFHNTTEYIEDFLPDYYYYALTDNRGNSEAYNSSVTTYAYSEAPLLFPARIDYNLATDGVMVASLSETFTPEVSIHHVGNFTLFIGYGPRGAATSIYYLGRYTTYWSRSLSNTWFYVPGSADVRTEKENVWSGGEDQQPLRLGSSLAMTLKMTTGDGNIISAQVVLPLGDYLVNETTVPFTCNDGFEFEKVCGESWGISKSRNVQTPF